MGENHIRKNEPTCQKSKKITRFIHKKLHEYKKQTQYVKSPLQV